jgi:hypothetical protein
MLTKRMKRVKEEDNKYGSVECCTVWLRDVGVEKGGNSALGSAGDVAMAKNGEGKLDEKEE